ncbi:MAG: 5-dehydro-2-deoxygluconokinase [Bifidobacteriaceae bacterium]|jgi:5-dehydro-2-deoxygluconokinase|nr:5-dehydro-2-deoxygluconokinase [Bifidobacteriaceae bacterium]
MDRSPVFDLLAMGRIGVDVYPNEVGVDLEDVETFRRYVGGTAANVTVAVARYGHSAALVSKVGDDAFGRYLRRDLAEEYGVDTQFLGTYQGLPTPLAFCGIKPPEDFPLYFYRTPSAPDLKITAADIQAPALTHAIETARIFWTTGTGLSEQPSASAQSLAYATRRNAKAATAEYTILDIDYRPMFWPSRATAHAAIAAALPYADVVVGNRDECSVAVGEGTPDEQADRLLAAGARLAVVKLGSAGVLGKSGADRVIMPPVPVITVNGLGAGDAFGGALSHGLLEGWPLERTLRFANAAGAYVAAQIACSAAMPTAAAVDSLLERAEQEAGL